VAPLDGKPAKRVLPREQIELPRQGSDVVLQFLTNRVQSMLFEDVCNDLCSGIDVHQSSLAVKRDLALVLPANHGPDGETSFLRSPRERIFKYPLRLRRRNARVQND